MSIVSKVHTFDYRKLKRVYIIKKKRKRNLEIEKLYNERNYILGEQFNDYSNAWRKIETKLTNITRILFFFLFYI